MRELFLDT